MLSVLGLVILQILAQYSSFSFGRVQRYSREPPGKNNNYFTTKEGENSPELISREYEFRNSSINPRDPKCKEN